MASQNYKQARSNAQGFYAVYVKRMLDVLIAGAALILFWWLLALLALIVRLNLGAPVIFYQERPGLDGRVFKLVKFRSMSDACDENGNLLPDEQRLNSFGRLLRSTSLDELPELYNVLKGDMSLVGPRPLLVSYLERYNSFESRRHEVRPGITGLAQVSGRNAIGWRERFEKDVEYVNHVSLNMDVQILLLTIKKVLVREGITFSGGETISDYFQCGNRAGIPYAGEEDR